MDDELNEEMAREVYSRVLNTIEDVYGISVDDDERRREVCENVMQIFFTKVERNYTSHWEKQEAGLEFMDTFLHGSKGERKEFIVALVDDVEQIKP